MSAADTIFEELKSDDDTRRELLAQEGVRAYTEATNSVMGIDPGDTPTTRDELWQAVKNLTGYGIPRVAVCEPHVAPFTTFADLYFGTTETGEPVTDVLWIGNRGGGKTASSGFLHGARARWSPGYTSAIVGATDKQSQRGYSEFQTFCSKIEDEILDSLKKQTNFVNGSVVEIMAATKKAVNGPHPRLAQLDELELVEREIYEEWLNMSQGDEEYPGQNLLTSTRKWPFGIVQELVKGAEEAVAAGQSPEYRVDIFCVWETVQNQPGCGTICGCEKVIKGTVMDTTIGKKKPRTLMDVCGGRAKRSQGFMKLADVQRRFKQLSRRTWNAQQECSRPGQEGVVHQWLDEEHMLPLWYPRTEYGPIFRSYDPGGTNPHAVLFHQLVKVPLLLKGVVEGQNYERKINPGQLVTFDEIYHSGGGYGALGIEAMERTAKWQQFGFEMDVDTDVCDPAAASAKVDIARSALEGGWPEPNWRMYPCPRIDSLERHIEWGEDGNLLIVPKYCPNTMYEYEHYHWPEQKVDKPPPKFPVAVDDHTQDAMRYIVWYLYKIGQRSETQEVPTSQEQKMRAPYERDRKRRVEDRKSYKTPGSGPPAASSVSPGYTSNTPGTDRPTVRKGEHASVRRG